MSLHRLANKCVAATAALLIALVAGCGGRESGEDRLTVFVAASLIDAMTAIGERYEAATGVEVAFNFAGSGALAQQIRMAPRGDVFVSASERWMDVVAEADRLAPGTRGGLLSNQLVLAAHPASGYAVAVPTDLAQLDFTHLAMGEPDAVPAGHYGREWLQSVSMGAGESTLWGAVASRVSPTSDVRAALALVAARRDVVGVVYRSDLKAVQDRVKALYVVPIADGPAIRYEAAVLAEAAAPEQGRAFLAFLRTQEAREVFEAHGFTVIDSR